MGRLRDRPTPDLIVFALTGVVLVILVLTTVGLLVAEIWYPERNVGMLAERVGQIMTSLIAAIVGYLAGRGVNGDDRSKQ